MATKSWFLLGTTQLTPYMAIRCIISNAISGRYDDCKAYIIRSSGGSSYPPYYCSGTNDCTYLRHPHIHAITIHLNADILQ